MLDRTFIFDFDSTFTSVEALDLLAEIVLENHPEQSEIVKEIEDITNLGIDGTITFPESLSRRIALFKANKSHLNQLTERLKQLVSVSVVNNRSFFETHTDQIYIVSCGFKEFIVPVVAEYGIPANRVYANTFEFDENDAIIGYDKDNVLSQENGKVKCVTPLNLKGEIQVIGDGYSDYTIRKAGLADTFFAYTEHVTRDKSIKHADFVVPNMDEFLYVNQLPRQISYPKSRMKILLLENIHTDAFHFLIEEGFTVEILSHSLSEDDLIEKIKDVHILGIRSKTQVTRKVIEAAPKLMAIGTFCIGTKQVDLETCKQNGIVVFNAPYSNTRSVVELAIGEIIMLMRQTFARSSEMHRGEWRKVAVGSNEVRGKVLGIVGYGNIGKQLSILAESLGMQVIYYDIEDRLALGNAKRCKTLYDLLEKSDAVSLHVDDHVNNKNLIGEKELNTMKNGAVLLNLSRGFVVDIHALKEALVSGKLSGAGVDVYPVEPRANGNFETELLGLENVILTPHVGGSTEEAQKDIADFVPNKIISYINTGNTVDAVNFPNIRLSTQQNVHRFLHIHKNVPGVIFAINEVLANHKLNISGQYLATDSDIGYVIIEVNNDYDNTIVNELRAIEHTIKFRVLY